VHCPHIRQPNAALLVTRSAAVKARAAAGDLASTLASLRYAAFGASARWRR
jgi:hypothetical protein